MKLGDIEHPYQLLFRKSGSSLLEVREIQAIRLEIRLLKTCMNGEGFRKGLSIGRLMLAVVKTEWAGIVMEEMAQWREGIADMWPELVGNNKELTDALKETRALLGR